VRAADILSCKGRGTSAAGGKAALRERIVWGFYPSTTLPLQGMI
jgi:hypothetical protein